MIQISGKSINLTLSGTIIALMLTTLAKLSLAQERGLILVVEVRGIVKLKRSQWKSYQTVYGTELARERYLIALKLANSENDLASNTFAKL